MWPPETERVLLSSRAAPPLSSGEERGYLHAALAENAFARLNAEALIGDGSRANYFTQLSDTLSELDYRFLQARARHAGIRTPLRTYADVFNAVVGFVDGAPVVDHERLLALRVLAPSVTLERLQSVLRFGTSAKGTGAALARGEAANETPTTTALTPSARPAGWATLEPMAAMEDHQPARSGWYLRVRAAWPDEFFSPWLGSHSSFGYYDAETRKWGMSSSLNYEYMPAVIPIPGTGSEMAIDENDHRYRYYEVAMGPEAVRQGLTPEQFNRAMVRDVVQFEAHYRALSNPHGAGRKIFYNLIPNYSRSRIDGNCNTYAHYLLASLGVDKFVYPRGVGDRGTAGQEVIARDAAGDVYIYGSRRGALAVTAPLNPTPVLAAPRGGP